MCQFYFVFLGKVSTKIGFKRKEKESHCMWKFAYMKWRENSEGGRTACSHAFDLL
jgi:hypothetical protein